MGLDEFEPELIIADVSLNIYRHVKEVSNEQDVPRIYCEIVESITRIEQMVRINYIHPGDVCSSFRLMRGTKLTNPDKILNYLNDSKEKLKQIVDIK